MHTATMEYPLTGPEAVAPAAALWREVVVGPAQGQPGLIHLQLHASGSSLLAIGTWREAADAEAFMRTGVFRTLMARLAPYLVGDPRPRQWTTEVFL